jgi:predicted nuclease with TOPRIM domain
MNLLRHRRERLALRAENETLWAEREDLLKRLNRERAHSQWWEEWTVRLRAERDQAEAELRALRGEVA